VMSPLPAAAVSQKIEQFEQSAPGGDQTTGTQIVAQENQFCNLHT
jgi:hypothetical protein